MVAGIRNSFTLLSWKFSFNCVFCLKRGLDSFICEASQLGRIFLPTYLYTQTVSLEHESLGLRKSSHTSTYTCVHSHTHTHAHSLTHTRTLTLKIEAAILLTLVNAPHPRQLDLHIFNVLFSLLFSHSPLCIFSFPPSVFLSGASLVSAEHAGGLAVHVKREFLYQKARKKTG